VLLLVVLLFLLVMQSVAAAPETAVGTQQIKSSKNHTIRRFVEPAVNVAH
jgi:hypothetical protein